MMILGARMPPSTREGRIGTAEIYRQVEAFDEVLEALAIGQAFDDDTRVVLFVRLAPGHHLDDLLRARIVKRLREQCSPRHVPAKIVGRRPSRGPGRANWPNSRWPMSSTVAPFATPRPWPTPRVSGFTDLEELRT